ncbi:CDGSH iron-sulfur domain-containing protein [Halegenticoccus tardaugens]|uniref:CDGSH iron-sulfur domain-containing protein n=1 Tax=Halegenticoccus tardaugens TaxID=2071624 RepID=UPI00100BE1E3|nr:CDGSH iron-sulfur domain-containing protein [Halegenticoccus tardaugens]
MARDVTHTARRPLIVGPEHVDEEKGDIAICRCGLSDDAPFCDGSHRATGSEEEGVRYRYDDGTRREVARIEYADGTVETPSADGERARDSSEEPRGTNEPTRGTGEPTRDASEADR